MSEQQQVFAVEELRILSHTCQHCGTVVMFDVTTDAKYGTPKRCSTCNEPLAEAAQAFADYRAFYQKAVDSKLTIQLRTKPVVAS